MLVTRLAPAPVATGVVLASSWDQVEKWTPSWKRLEVFVDLLIVRYENGRMSRLVWSP